MNLKRKLQCKLKDMKTRCYNSNNHSYKNHGARGITVCDEWLGDSKAFVQWSLDNGYEGTLTIDRIDNDKGYSPSNCRYVNYGTQNRNTRQNVFITYKGETLCFKDWSIKLGINRLTLWCRIYKWHWSVERAFEEPIGKNYGRKNV